MEKKWKCKNFRTSFVQTGVAPEIGLDQSAKTTVCAAILGDWHLLPEFFLREEDEGLLDVVYTVEVTHPSVYAGTLEDLRRSCILAAEHKLREVGVLKKFKTRIGDEEEFLVKID